MTTIKEIAERAGVSTTTVSNVIHGKTKKVSSENIKKIQALIDEMGYVQKLGLRVLNKKNSQLIAVIINFHKEYEQTILGDPFYGKVLGFIEKEIRDRNYYMMLYSAKDMDDIFRMVMAWDVDGVIALSFSKSDCVKIRNLIKKPIISIDAYGETGEESVPNIGLDDVAGGYLMTQYLLRCGYENIIVCASRDYGVDHMRWIGAQKAMQEAENEVRIQFTALGNSRSYRESQYQQIARQVPFKKKTAVFFLSDLFALEAIHLFSGQGIRIPEQIGVAGYDDIFYSKLSMPKLTTIHQNIQQKAELAVEELIRCIEDPLYCPKLNYNLPVSLVARQSI